MTTPVLLRSETAPPVRPRGRLALVLRPFGYTLVAAVWIAISALILALGPGILGLFAWFAWFDGDPSEGFTFVEDWSRLTESASEMTAFVLSVPLIALIWGPAVLWMLPCASLPLAALALTYVGRSFRSRYAGDALSFTTQGKRGSTMGITATSVALSLQPVHRSRWTDLLMRFYFEGWDISLRALVAMLPAGLAWLLLLVANGVDVPVALRVTFAVLGVGLAVWSVVMVRRHWLARFYGIGSAPERRERVGRRVTDLSADERARRLQELKERRAARLEAAEKGSRDGDPSPSTTDDRLL